jgi:hypothetical protein
VAFRSPAVQSGSGSPKQRQRSQHGARKETANWLEEGCMVEGPQMTGDAARHTCVAFYNLTGTVSKLLSSGTVDEQIADYG